MTDFGGQEPGWVKATRSAYYMPWIRFRRLEDRIAQSLSGQAWLDRLRQKKLR